MANPEIKVNRDCNEELKKIDSEIFQAQKDLDNFKKSNNPEFQLQIETLEKKLNDLQKQKQKIISETQCWLAWEKIWKNEIAQAKTHLDNANLSWEERKKVENELNKQWNTFDATKVENGWILWIILAILQALMSWIWFAWNNEYAEADSTENPGKTIKWRERTSKDKEIFVSEYKDLAKQIEKEHGIPWEFIITQAWLESAWGTSWLAVNYNNLFGIKAKKWWKSVMLWTWEEINWQKVRKKEPFRVYKNALESFRDHAIFLKENKRYANAFNFSHNPTRFALEIAKAWYATDGDYAWKLTSTMKSVA